MRAFPADPGPATAAMYHPPTGLLRRIVTMRRLLPIAVAGLLLLSGCSGSPNADADREPSITPTSEAELPAECLTPTEGTVALLQEDVAATVPGVKFLGAGAKKGEDPGFWLIALKFDDPELNVESVAVWGSMQDITTEQDAAFIAVDEMAEIVSTYAQPVVFDGVNATTVDIEDCIVG